LASSKLLVTFLLQWVYLQTFEFSIVPQLHPNEPFFFSHLVCWPLVELTFLCGGSSTGILALLLRMVYAHINKWLVPFDHNNINSNFWFGILFFFFHYFLPYKTINSYMSFFPTTKTPHSILPKFIILIILTTTSPILTIWSWIILLISKLIIWCVIFMWLFLLLHN